MVVVLKIGQKNAEKTAMEHCCGVVLPQRGYGSRCSGTETDVLAAVSLCGVEWRQFLQ